MPEYQDKRVWNIDNHKVTFLHIDHRFAFECWWPDDNQISVVIECMFILQFLDKTVYCKPDNIDTMKEAVLILHKAVSMLTAHRDGRLIVDFSDGTKLLVSRDAQYEAWEVRGKGEFEDIALLCTSHDGPPWSE